MDKILEMVAVMRHAAQSDEDNYDRTTREQEILINKLVTENKVSVELFCKLKKRKILI